jgi:hypothetical protein
MKKISFALLTLMLGLSCIAQTQQEKKKLPFEIGADLVSRYVWRGQSIDKTPNIQPFLIYAPDFGLQVGAWGSYGFTGDYAEVDLFLSYSIAGFSATLTDYFVMNESIAKNHFFDYRNDRTGHVLEGCLAYEGPEKFPLRVLGATMFYGADKKLDHLEIDTVANDTTSVFVNQFSTYFEVGYTIRNIEIFAGITPMSGYYGNEFGLVNFGIAGSRDIKITDHYSLPIKAALITNPQRQNIHLVFTLSL